MYRLSPIISTETMVFDLPTTMYKLPVIQNSNNGESSNQSQELSNDDLNELKQLEKKQEAILSQLEALKIDVAKLSKTAGNQTKADIIQKKLEQLSVTIARIETLFAPSASKLKIVSKPKLKVSGVTDVVIRASPNHAPHTLPIICKKLQEVFKVFTSAHIHSSLPKGIPNKLKDFLPASNCASRSKADLCVTLIWTNGNETEMATSPTSSLLVKGEINLLRYFARRFNLFNANEMTEIHLAQAESLLDSTYCEAMWGAGNLNKMVSSTLEPVLKNSKFLATGNKISLVDVYVYALFTGESNAKKYSPIFTDWLKRCEQAINGSQG